MTGEEMERAIEFLLQSHAAHDIRLDQLTTQVAETGRQLQAYAQTQSEFIQIATRTMEGLANSQAGLTDAHKGLSDSHTRLANAQAGLTDAHRGLADSHTRLANSQAGLTDAHKRLAEAQAHTERIVADTNARLDRLAGMVEQHLANHS